MLPKIAPLQAWMRGFVRVGGTSIPSPVPHSSSNVLCIALDHNSIGLGLLVLQVVFVTDPRFGSPFCALGMRILKEALDLGHVCVECMPLASEVQSPLPLPLLTSASARSGVGGFLAFGGHKFDHGYLRPDGVFFMEGGMFSLLPTG